MNDRLDDATLIHLTEQYVALWNEPDPDTRRKHIAELWAKDGVQVLTDPPQEIRETADGLAYPIPYLQVRGHRELDARVTRAYEMFIAPGEYVFRARARAARLTADLVGLGSTMVVTADGTEAGTGYDVLALDETGRIRSDHQFIGPA
ncbi:hypothetical protein [Nocardia otitidiscaviarum]|uniref:hypothetical protein n=1 Tax=Nocardia otitidiscaviarum TaxID=1823 RepID=UPI001893D59B|nr:hypothetical protein [Nocardia otitidiscaviarum]MBF6181954.1 hypothetical protein [Nocardia otitidiscaviarum]